MKQAKQKSEWSDFQAECKHALEFVLHFQKLCSNNSTVQPNFYQSAIYLVQN